MNNTYFNCKALRAGIAVCMALLAADVWAAKVDFAGFASFVYGKTLSDDDKHGDKNDGLYGMSNDGSMRELSLLGLRMNSTLEDYKLSFTAQAVMYGNDDYKPTFDWAYATYGLGAGWEISAGRTRTPLFMYSAYQDVAYAYPWVKPPFSVYGLPQFKSVDGLKLRHQTTFADWASELQIWYGSIREQLKENGLDSELELDNSAGIAWSVERDWLTLRAVYMQAKTSLDLTSNPDMAGMMQILDGVSQTFAAIDPQIQAQVQSLQNRVDWNNDKAQFYGVGAGFDFGHVFLTTEATLIDMNESIAAPSKMESYYVVLGTRIVPKWTFSLTVSQDKDREHKSLIRDYAAVIDPAMAIMTGIADPDVQGLLAVMTANNLDGAGFAEIARGLQHFDTIGYTLTARWDFHRSAAAKIEYLQEEREYGNNGQKLKPQAIRLGVDLVF